MDSLYDLLPDMYVELPDCPEPLQKQHLRLAAREFCRRTEAYQRELSPIDIVADQSDYNLSSGCSGRIARVLWVKTGTDIGDNLPNISPLAVGQYTLTREFTLTLHNTPATDITDGLYVKVAIRPNFDIDPSLPSWFMERYATALKSGAKATLMAMGNKSWTDKELAAEYKREFLYCIGEGRAETYRQHKFGDVMIKFRSFD